MNSWRRHDEIGQRNKDCHANIDSGKTSIFAMSFLCFLDRVITTDALRGERASVALDLGCISGLPGTLVELREGLAEREAGRGLLGIPRDEQHTERVNPIGGTLGFGD